MRLIKRDAMYHVVPESQSIRLPLSSPWAARGAIQQNLAAATGCVQGRFCLALERWIWQLHLEWELPLPWCTAGAVTQGGKLDLSSKGIIALPPDAFAGMAKME
jgi:hypothetical protein